MHDTKTHAHNQRAAKNQNLHAQTQDHQWRESYKNKQKIPLYPQREGGMTGWLNSLYKE